MELLFLLTGVLLGAVTTWFILGALKSNRNQLSEADLKSKYVLKEVFAALETQTDLLRADLHEKE